MRCGACNNPLLPLTQLQLLRIRILLQWPLPWMSLLATLLLPLCALEFDLCGPCNIETVTILFVRHVTLLRSCRNSVTMGAAGALQQSGVRA